MDDLRIGVLGFGLRAALAEVVQAPGSGGAVVAVADNSARGRAEARARLGSSVAIEHDLDALLAHDLDAVMVLTPDHLHLDHAVRVLDAGVAAFVEKPLATTVADADRILRTAYDSRTRLYIGHNLRHLPVIVAMREAIRAGKIGEVKAVWCRHFVSRGGDYYFKDWHADRRNTGSLLLQKGAHDLDAIHWLAGGYARRVAAMGALSVYGDVAARRDNSDRRLPDWFSVENWPPSEQRDLSPVIDVEDLSLVNLALDNGVLASYQQCHFTPDYWRNYTVIGTHGRLENLGDSAGARVHLWNTRNDTDQAAPDEVIEVATGDGGHGGADPLLVGEFLRFVREGGRTDTSPVAAREAVAAAVGATASLRSGGAAVEVPELPAELTAYFERGQVP